MLPNPRLVPAVRAGDFYVFHVMDLSPYAGLIGRSRESVTGDGEFKQMTVGFLRSAGANTVRNSGWLRVARLWRLP